MDVQPGTFMPIENFIMIRIRARRKLKNDIPIPVTEIILRGILENEIRPLMAKRINL